MKWKIICVACPLGCEIEIEGNDTTVERVSGNRCKRGLAYAEQEVLHPMRLLTASVRVSGASRRMLPIRSTKPIPKEALLRSMEVIRRTKVAAPIKDHQVIIPNILATGADMVASMPLPKEEEN